MENKIVLQYERTISVAGAGPKWAESNFCSRVSIKAVLLVMQQSAAARPLTEDPGALINTANVTNLGSILLISLLGLRAAASMELGLRSTCLLHLSITSVSFSRTTLSPQLLARRHHQHGISSKPYGRQGRWTNIESCGPSCPVWKKSQKPRCATEGREERSRVIRGSYLCFPKHAL